MNPRTQTAATRAENLIVGESAAIVELRRLIHQVAPSSASVLVTGPSGSGKEMVARAIHAESCRNAKSYVAINCGAIPRELLESELFGHEKGSFTGAIARKQGRFEEADQGTLFLDEIGDMPADMQVKLLRVLEEHSIQRVGGQGEIGVDVRVISATHRNIEEAIEAQRFREDLYYRLAIFPIEIPALAERREDVPLLVRHFIRMRKTRLGFTAAAMDRLVEHGWPGNVRELRNLVERAAILFPDEAIGPEQVGLLLLCRLRSPKPQSPAPSPSDPPSASAAIDDAAPPPSAAPAAAKSSAAFHGGPIDLRKLMAEVEYRYVTEALRASEGVVADAARLLSLQRTTLIEKMRKLGLAKAA